MKPLNCWYLNNGIYMDHTVDGYRVLPCCKYRHVDKYYSVDSPNKIQDHFFMKEIKNDFANGIKHKGCEICWHNEEVNGNSKRLSVIPANKQTGKYQNWDLRFGNLCNLKCVMCQPQCSTKWYEDIDIYTTHRGGINVIESLRSKNKFDWDYVKKHTPNNAYRIYFAGGEPLYDKNVFEFVNYLSEFDWNIENTYLTFNTNGISYTDKWSDLLKKFKINPTMITSIDGIGKVDEYIRYPTNFNEKKQQAKLIKKINIDISYNLTISALNFPVSQEVIKKYKPDLNTLVHPNFLHINSLKPDIIYRLKKTKNKHPYIADLIKKYKYNDEGNKKLKAYLQDLDNKRNTDSKRVLPWCWA